MSRVHVATLFVALFAGWAWTDGQAQAPADGRIVSGAHRFEKVTDGIFYATSSGVMNTGANSVVILTDTEAVIVDSSITPAAARALVTDLRAISNLPVKYVIDSHYHYDHAHGNQIFGSDVQVIGHENTRKRMLTNVLEQYTFLSSVQPIPGRIAALKERIAQEKDPQQRAALERQSASSQAYLEQVKETVVTPPNLTMDRRMTLFRGGREIQIHYLGRGHTDTDVVVFLPKERIVCTGDLMESIISYMGDAFVEDWIPTLERLKTLDFDTVIPAHGVVFKGKTKITAFQAYLKDVHQQSLAFKKQGLTPETAAEKIDVAAHRTEFTTIRPVGIDPAGVRRIYQLADKPEPE